MSNPPAPAESPTNPARVRQSSILLVRAATVAVVGFLAWPRGPVECADMGQAGDERHDTCRLEEGLAAKSAAGMDAACRSAGNLESACRSGWVAKLEPSMVLDDVSLAVVCASSGECATRYLATHPAKDVLEQMQRCSDLAGVMAVTCHDKVLEAWVQSEPSKLEMRRVAESPSVNVSAAAYWAGVAARCYQVENVCPEGEAEAAVRCRAGVAEATERTDGCRTAT